jgi:hypothetical protein
VGEGLGSPGNGGLIVGPVSPGRGVSDDEDGAGGEGSVGSGLGVGVGVGDRLGVCVAGSGVRGVREARVSDGLGLAGASGPPVEGRLGVSEGLVVDGDAGGSDGVGVDAGADAVG